MTDDLAKRDLLTDKKWLIKECIQVENDLLNDDIIPRKGRMSILFLLAITDEDKFLFFREDISKIDRIQLCNINANTIESGNIKPYRELLTSYDCDEYYWGTTYVFASPPPPEDFPDVKMVKQGNTLVFVIEKDGKIVSKAWTWGECSTAAEVEVETHEDYRRKGYAKQTVSAWAAWQMKKKPVVIYSHEFSNLESGKLANRLNLIKIATIFIYYQRRAEEVGGRS